MKKFVQWLAKVFDANITVEKEVVKTVEKKVEVPVIKEVVKEVPVEVIKEVTKEVPVEKIVKVERLIYVVSSTISSDTKLIEGDVVIDGDLEVNGNLYVSGGVTCFNDIEVMKNVKKKGNGI